MPEFDRAGAVRGPSGPTVSGIVPSNAYPTADGERVVVGANNSANFRRLMTVVGRADLAADPELEGNPGRVRRQGEIDEAIARWTGSLAAGAVVEQLVAATVPVSTIYTVADMFADPHYRARGLFESVEAAGRALTLPAMLPQAGGDAGRDRVGGAGARGAQHRGPLRRARTHCDRAFGASGARRRLTSAPGAGVLDRRGMTGRAGRGSRRLFSRGRWGRGRLPGRVRRSRNRTAGGSGCAATPSTGRPPRLPKAHS